ncbi:MAG: FliA/WhiG family RNA polymerase sigma factor [Candidatus Eisenbacteria sp.]|nr:FliA/WhiG family RNA polymerase sigma factor [Candidatus Eisenbacteria bacterium]
MAEPLLRSEESGGAYGYGCGDSAIPTEEAWRRYKHRGDPMARDQLVLEYIRLAKYVAGRLAIGLPPTVQIDDLISSGILGLMDAIEKYDPKRDTKFETYAMTRIRGAMLDELRALDWVPRSTRRKARLLEDAYAGLEAQLGRSATDQEVSSHLKISTRILQEMVAEISVSSLLSLDGFMMAGSGEEVSRLIDHFKDTEAPSPSAHIEVEEVKDILGDAIGNLPRREKEVVSLYYFEEMTMKEIGGILGVSESRVCQIHTKAILRLRARLRSNTEALAKVFAEGSLGKEYKGVRGRTPQASYSRTGVNAGCPLATVQ